MYEHKMGYERAIFNSKIASLERYRAPVAQDSVIGYVTERSHWAYYRGFSKLCESVKQIVLWIYAAMVRSTKILIPFDQDAKKAALTELSAITCRETLKLHPGRLRELYRGKAYLREPDQTALDMTKRCL